MGNNSRKMLLTEEQVSSQVPRTPEERLNYIVAQEKAWLSLPWDRKRYTTEQAQTAITLLSAIAFSDFRDPIDLSHLPESRSLPRNASIDHRGGSISRNDLEVEEKALLASEAASESHSGSGSARKSAPRSRSRSQSVSRSGSAIPSPNYSGTARDSDGEHVPDDGTVRQATKNHEQYGSHQNGYHTKRRSESPDYEDNETSSKRGLKRLKTGESQPSAHPIAKGTQVACLVQTSNLMWVLGRVNRYLPDSKKYEIDDDADGERQKYLVLKKDLRVIPKRPPQFDMKKRVRAVYPLTTVFYPATLVARIGKGRWAVEFDDEDDLVSDKIKHVDGRLILQD